MTDYECKKCGFKKHWHFLNAIECCQDLSEEEIQKKIDRQSQLGESTK